jgi:hypothetical protein
MLTRVSTVALVVVLSLGFRSSAGAQASPSQQSSMVKPPPVSGQSYRVEAGLEERSNYISGGITGGAGYIDNLYPGSGMGQEGDTTIVIRPSIAFDTSSARINTSASYNPTFNFYQPSGSLNEADHNAAFKFQYRFSPRLAMSLNDSLVRSSNGFNQIGTSGISGSTSATAPGIIVPFGERFTNIANAELSYQFSPHGMIGALGDVGNQNYGNTSQTAGLYNSESYGGGGFYNHRLSASQYLGAIYGYEQTLATPAVGEYETQTHSVNAFYTLYLTETFSLSVAGGPQYYRASHAPDPTTSSWSPTFTTSMGWQGRHTAFAAYFSRSVTGGGGLLGSFYSKSAGAEGTWRFSRLWDAELGVNYTISKNATPLFLLTSPGGHSFNTSLSLGRTLSPHTRAALRYDRIQNRYGGIPSIVSNPNTDRIMVSLSWDFRRPIGR